MREIKFRAWDGERMHKAFDLTQNPVFWWKDNYDYPLMQFTGVKDKNGVEVYEGDIVCKRGARRDVRFAEGSFTLNHTNHCSSSVSSWYGRELEVIGNIYENPELQEAAA